MDKNVYAQVLENGSTDPYEVSKWDNVEKADKRLELTADFINNSINPDLSKVVDFGCGSGLLIDKLSPAVSYLGVDSCKEVVDYTAERFPDREIVYVPESETLAYLAGLPNNSYVAILGTLSLIDSDDADYVVSNIINRILYSEPVAVIITGFIKKEECVDENMFEDPKLKYQSIGLFEAAIEGKNYQLEVTYPLSPYEYFITITRK